MSADPDRNRSTVEGHQVENLSARWIVGTAIALLSLLVSSIACIYLFESLFISQRSINSAREQWQIPRPGAGVEPNQAYQRRQWEWRNKRWLESYGWQDDAHRVARIPIRRAIDMMAERDLTTPWKKASQHTDRSEGNETQQQTPSSPDKTTLQEAGDE